MPETPEANHSPATPSFCAQLSQICKSSLNTACKWPLIQSFFTQQVPFDDTHSEETDSGELDYYDEDDRSAVHALALGRKDHL